MIWVPGGWWIAFVLMAIFFWRPWRWGRRPMPPWDWDRYGRRPEPRKRAELDDSVAARLDLVDQLETRVTELENRLDFAERLLAGRNEEKAVS